MSFITRLFCVDTLIFAASFLAVLSARAPQSVESFLFVHVVPFSVLFIAYILTLYLFGFYDTETPKTQSAFFSSVLRSSTFLLFFGVTLFYAVPAFGVTPKTNLVLFFLVLATTLFLWRAYGAAQLIESRTRAILIGEDDTLANELSSALGYVRIVATAPKNFSKEQILSCAQTHRAKHILFDFSDDSLIATRDALEESLFDGYTFLDTHAVREDVLGYIDLARVDEKWFFTHARTSSRRAFIFKRAFDVVFSIALLPILIILTPFVALGIYLYDRKKIFIKQKRYGLHRKIITLYKFRTMTCDDDGKWHGDAKNVVTPLGAFLRKTRIDELPQLLNVIRGDISLIGPRPDIIALGEKLSEEIPHYSMRYLIRPGLSGWAQVSQGVVPQSIEESAERLAFDLYYIKHASIFLDIKIFFKTIRRVLRDFGI